MHRETLQLLPHSTSHHQHLLLPPLEHVAEQAEREALQPPQRLGDVVHADLLHLGVLGPRPDGELEAPVLHVDEAGLLGPLLQAGAGTGVPADVLGHVQQRVDPLVRAGRLGVGAVFRVVGQVEVLEFGPAAGVEVSRKGGQDFLFLSFPEKGKDFPRVCRERERRTQRRSLRIWASRRDRPPCSGRR